MNLSKLNPLNWFKRYRDQNVSQASEVQPSTSNPAATWDEHPLVQWHRDFERAFDNLWSSFNPPFQSLNRASKWEDSSPERYRYAMNMEGFNEQDIQLSLSGNKLTVRAEINDEQVNNGWRQFQRRQYVQRVTLPRDADVKNIQAQLNNGQLTIDIARSQLLAQKARDIPITVHQ